MRLIVCTYEYLTQVLVIPAGVLVLVLKYHVEYLYVLEYLNS